MDAGDLSGHVEYLGTSCGHSETGEFKDSKPVISYKTGKPLQDDPKFSKEAIKEKKERRTHKQKSKKLFFDGKR